MLLRRAFATAAAAATLSLASASVAQARQPEVLKLTAEQNLKLTVKRLEARVLDLIARDLEREPFTVVQTEAECSVDVGGVQVRVKLDRVDRLADGSHAVIDYKTGANARPAAWMGERPESPAT